MFPDRRTMIRRANAFWIILVVATALYLAVAFDLVVQFKYTGFGDTFFPILFLGMLVVSATNLGFVAFTQTSKRFLPALAATNPVSWVFQVLVIGSILSEALAVYGLLLTLVSGSLTYAVGFTLGSWASILWVRTRFKRNLEKLPDK